MVRNFVVATQIIALGLLTASIVGVVVYTAWSNYTECRSLFSVFYCVTTHIFK